MRMFLCITCVIKNCFASWSKQKEEVVKVSHWEYFPTGIVCTLLAGCPSAAAASAQSDASCCCSPGDLVMGTAAATLLSNTAYSIHDPWLLNSIWSAGNYKKTINIWWVHCTLELPWMQWLLEQACLFCLTPNFLEHRVKNITKPRVSHIGIWDLHQVSQLCVESPFQILNSLCYFSWLTTKLPYKL